MIRRFFALRRLRKARIACQRRLDAALIRRDTRAIGHAQAALRAATLALMAAELNMTNPVPRRDDARLTSL